LEQYINQQGRATIFRLQKGKHTPPTQDFGAEVEQWLLLHLNQLAY
jgi:hypothetical protein